MTSYERFTVELFAPTVTASVESRTIAGTIAVFGTASADGRVFEPGSITARQPISAVKLLLDHDQAQPIGYLQALDVGDDTARAVFKIPAGAPGDAAIAGALAGLRDAFSVGVAIAPGGYEFDDAGLLHFTAGELVETSLVAVPAFSGTQVDKVAAALGADRERGHNSMNTITTAGTAPVIPLTAAGVADPISAPAAPGVPAEFSAGPSQAPAPAAPPTVTARPISLQQASMHVAEAIRSGQTSLILAALGDVVPADDLGHGFLGREDWIGQVWQATKQGRPWIDSFGTPKPLTSTKIKGWAWDVRPKPAKYAGNKADVPTNAPKTKPVEATPERWAGGWDIDRIYVDLGDPSFLTEFWTAAALEYQVDSDADVATDIVTAATPATLVATTVIAAITEIAGVLRQAGARTDRVWLAGDLWAEYAGLGTADVPFWLANQVGGVDLQAGSTNAGGLVIDVDDALDAGQIVAYDTRAASVYEKAPFMVTALDVARGGIDLGFYSYGGTLIHDAAGIAKATLTALPLAAKASK